MKILLINAIKESQIGQPPALGPLYLASYLEKYGGYKQSDFKVIECQRVNDESLCQYNPDLVGISSITQNFSFAIQMCAKIKGTLGIPVIIGGVHISTLPQSFPFPADIGVVGEGEETFLQIVNEYENGLIRKGQILGICYHDNGQLKITSRRPLIQPLDMIPPPDRGLVEIRPNQEHHMITSRGCPFSCSFCSPYAMWRSVRYWSADNVIKEIRQIYEKYRPRVIGIQDDLFATNKPRLRTIAAFIQKEEFYGKVRFLCSARANLMDYETARLLKSIGVQTAMMGLESGTDHILNYLKCGSATVAQNKLAVDVLADTGIEAAASFIIGSPGETKEEMLSTFRFAKESRLSYFAAFVLTPLPGTKVWDYALSKGLVSENMDWSRLAYMDKYSSNAVNLSTLADKELLEILSLFEKESRRRKRKRNINAGIRHPERILHRGKEWLNSKMMRGLK